MSCLYRLLYYATTDLLVKIRNPKCHFAKKSQALRVILWGCAGSKRGSWEVSSSANIDLIPNKLA